MHPVDMTHWGLYFGRGPSLAETQIETELPHQRDLIHLVLEQKSIYGPVFYYVKCTALHWMVRPSPEPGRPGLELSSPLKIMAGGLDELKEEAPLNGIWFNNKCRITDNGLLLIGISVQTAPKRSRM
ncbi:unnamed protein product [Prunus brigantina]